MTSPLTTQSPQQDERLTVLHVDDEPEFGELTAEFLEREDERFDVVTETNASHGLDRLGVAGIDCIVSDYDMPEMDGLEFLEAVRADRPDLPFILYTGTGSEEIASEAISAGVTDYLEKEAGRHQYTVLANRVRTAVEQYRAKRQLRETHEGYSRLLQESADFIFTADTERTITCVTPSIERVLGYTPDEVIGTDAFEQVHPDDLETAREGVADVLDPDSDQTTIELRVGHRDGSWRWLELRGRDLLDDPTLDGFVVNVRDVTEREELLEMSIQDIDATGVTSEWTSSEWIRARTDEPGELTHERKDGTTYPVEVNATDAELEHGKYVFAIARDVSDRKKREDDLEDLHDATRRLMDATAFEDVARIGVEAAEEILDLEITGFHTPDEDGEALVPVALTQQARELFGTASRIERGESLAWQVYETGESIFTEDVHDHPNVQNPETPVRSEMLIPARDHGVFIAAATEPDAFDDTDTDLARVLVANLCHAIDRVNRERQLRERERALERENERLEEVASVISHDLRNPLNVIKGRLDMARQEHDSEHFEPMLSSLDRSFDIIEDVLTLVQQGQSIEETEPVTLSTAVENCWRNVDTDEAEFRVGSDITFAANADRFRHVLENLFRNAVEHAGREVTIRIGRLEEGFYVEDDGPGIPPEDRDQVFDSGYSTSDDGTGFGLHIVRQIVDAHGWEIDVTDGDAGGARFEITGVDVAT